MNEYTFPTVHFAEMHQRGGEVVHFAEMHPRGGEAKAGDERQMGEHGNMRGRISVKCAETKKCPFMLKGRNV